MDDDFNTPEALAVMQGVARNLNLAKAAGNAAGASKAAATLRALGEMLGVLQQDPDSLFEAQCGRKELIRRGSRGAARARRAARAVKEFAESDRIREF